MYNKTLLNFDGVRREIGPVYLPIIDFLDSLNVSSSLTQENLEFTFVELIQNWKLTVQKDNQDFAILCNKRYNIVTIQMNLRHSISHKFKEYDRANEIYSLDEKYGDIDTSIAIINRPDAFLFFCSIHFEKIPTEEQVALLYRDLFLDGE